MNTAQEIRKITDRILKTKNEISQKERILKNDVNTLRIILELQGENTDKKNTNQLLKMADQLCEDIEDKSMTYNDVFDGLFQDSEPEF